MNWQGTCSNKDCKHPANFTVLDARPVTVAMLICPWCKSYYRFLLKEDGAYEFEIQNQLEMDVFDLLSSQPSPA
jgi:hypothetical protein